MDAVKALILNGTDINSKDKQGWTALHWAVEKNNPELVDLLIQNGADIYHKDMFKKSPLFYALKRSRKEILDHIIIEFWLK